MTGKQDTGNGARLPLPERVRRGGALEIHEILSLEFPSGQNPDYQQWRQLIEQAIRFDMLPVYLEVGDDGCLPGTEWICRRDYLAWRDRRSGLPVNSLIEAWRPSASEPAQPESDAASEPDRPEPGAAGIQNPATNRQCVADKARFLDGAIWEGTQQATINQHPEAAYFKGKYDAPALLKWASEIDPRPKDQRGGRPRKS